MSRVILLLFSFFNLVTFASDLSPDFYLLPENAEFVNNNLSHNLIFDKSNKTSLKSVIPKRRFNKKLDSLLDFFQSSLKDNKLKKKYYLFGVNTSIALGLSGNIGVLAWGGRTTLQLFWHRR